MNHPLHLRHRRRILLTGGALIVVGIPALVPWYAAHSEMSQEHGLIPTLTVLVVVFAVWELRILTMVWRHWIETDSDRIVLQGALRRKEMRWDDVELAEWKVGAVKLSGPMQKMRIDFGSYSPEESRLLIDAIRSALPAGVHRDERRPLRTQPDPNIDYELPGGEPGASTLPTQGLFENEDFVPSRKTRQIVRQAIISGLVVFAALSLWFFPAILMGGGGVVFLFAAVGFGGMTSLLGLIGVLEGKVGRAEIRSDRIVFDRGWFKTEQAWQDIRKVVWATRPAVIELMGDVRNVRIGLFYFAPEDQLALIRRLRNGLPPAIQANWPRFCHAVALPLREARMPEPPAPTIPGPGEYLRTRWHVDRWMIPTVLSVFGLIGGLHYFYQVLTFSPKETLGAAWIGLLPLAAIWAALRFSVPAEGCVAKRTRWSRQEYAIALLVLGGFLVLATIKLAKWKSPAALIVSYLVLLGCALAILLLVAPNRRLQEENRTRELEESKRAAEHAIRKWEQMDAELL